MVETDTITAWIPFDGSTHATGCMGYIPGSHAVGLQAFVNIFKPEDAIEILKMPQIKDTPPVYVEVPRGGVAVPSWADGAYGEANSGSQTRRVHTMIFFRDGSTRKNHFPHDSVERYHVEIGAKIDSPVTPIAWPRAAGDLARAARRANLRAIRKGGAARRVSRQKAAAPTASCQPAAGRGRRRTTSFRASGYKGRLRCHRRRHDPKISWS